MQPCKACSARSVFLHYLQSSHSAGKWVGELGQGLTSVVAHPTVPRQSHLARWTLWRADLQCWLWSRAAGWAALSPLKGRVLTRVLWWCISAWYHFTKISTSCPEIILFKIIQNSAGLGWMLMRLTQEPKAVFVEEGTNPAAPLIKVCWVL